MKMNNELSVVFRELSKEIQKLNDADIAKIVSGQAKLELQIVDKAKLHRTRTAVQITQHCFKEPHTSLPRV